MKSAGEVIALDGFRLSTPRYGDALEFLPVFRSPQTVGRLPRIGRPDLTIACRPPAPITFGRVQPGNGKKRSRAPVASIRFRYRSSQRSSSPSANNTLASGWSKTLF